MNIRALYSVASVQELSVFHPSSIPSGLSLPRQAEVPVTGQVLQVGVGEGSVCNTAPSVKYNTVTASIVLAAC